MGLLLLDSGAIKEEYIFGIGEFKVTDRDSRFDLASVFDQNYS